MQRQARGSVGAPWPSMFVDAAGRCFMRVYPSQASSEPPKLHRRHHLCHYNNNYTPTSPTSLERSYSPQPVKTYPPEEYIDNSHHCSQPYESWRKYHQDPPPPVLSYALPANVTPPYFATQPLPPPGAQYAAGTPRSSRHPFESPPPLPRRRSTSGEDPHRRWRGPLPLPPWDSFSSTARPSTAPAASDIESDATVVAAAAAAARTLSTIPQVLKEPSHKLLASTGNKIIEDVAEHWTIREELDEDEQPESRVNSSMLEQVFSVEDVPQRQRRRKLLASEPNTTETSATIPTTSSILPSQLSNSVRFVVEIAPKRNGAQTAMVRSIARCADSADAGADAQSVRLPGQVALRVGAVKEALERLGAEVQLAPAASAAALSAAAGDASALYQRLQCARERSALVAGALERFRSSIYEKSGAAERGGVAVSVRARALVHEMTLHLTELERDVRDQALCCQKAQQQMKDTPPPPVSTSHHSLTALRVPDVDFTSQDVFDSEAVSLFLDNVLDCLNSVVKLASTTST